METQATQRQRVAQSYRFIQILEKCVNKLSLWLNWLAGGGLVLMLALVVGDIIGIKIFAAPIPGAIEIVAFLGAVVIGFAVAYTQVLHGHIRVDFIVLKFPPRLASVIDVVMVILGMGIFHPSGLAFIQIRVCFTGVRRGLYDAEDTLLPLRLRHVFLFSGDLPGPLSRVHKIHY